MIILGPPPPQLSQLVVNFNGWFIQGRNILYICKYEYFVKKKVHAFGFSCLNYGAPENRPFFGKFFVAKERLLFFFTFFINHGTKCVKMWWVLVYTYIIHMYVLNLYYSTPRLEVTRFIWLCDIDTARHRSLPPEF